MTIAMPPKPPAPHTRFRTAVEWLHDLGNVPLERIRFDPWPGSATEADVVRLEERENRLCELVNGTLVEKPMGLVESIIAGVLIRVLGTFVESRRLGVVTAPDGMLRLSRDLVRIPDVAFISFARMPGGVLPNEPIPSLAPDMACEILSKSNTPAEMRRKLREYFDAGTRLVWIIDPPTRSATVHTSPEQSVAIPADGKLSGAEVLPGFEVALAELFANVPR
jgi:Uma2 family endonuclease